MKYGLSEKQLDEIIAIISAHPEIEEAVLFGSRTIDTYKEASDVDIALKGEQVTAALAAKLKYQFEEETYLPFFFDFVAYPTITNEALREHINTKGISIFRKGWRECKLRYLVLKIGSGATPRGGSNDYKADGISLIRSQNVLDFSFSFPGLAFIDDEQADGLKNVIVEKNDVLLNITGDSVARCCIVPDHVLPARVNQHVSIVRLNPDKADYRYIFYSLMTLKEELLMQAEIGATRKALTKSMIEKLYILLPPLPEQKAIASVLSSLDDKIDLLHRQNKTLEAMAETLFRQWFVEEAQEDWEEGSLLAVIQLIGGGTPKTEISEYWNGDIPWLAGGDIASNHKSFINSSVKSITELGLKNCSAKLLPKYATVISARGTVGKYCLLAEPMAFSQSNYGILPKPEISECFFFTYLLVNHVVEELQSSAYGSVFDTITTTTFKEIKIPLPTEAEIFQFEQAVSSYFHKIFLNKSQINTLETLRETLLPKLMSAEVRVQYDKESTQ